MGRLLRPGLIVCPVVVYRRQNDRKVLLVAVVLLAGALVLGLLVAAAQMWRRAEPPVAPRKVSVVEPWCVDPATMLVLDDDVCERDDDFDGVADGFLYVPPPGVVKPPRGERLPNQVKLPSAVRVSLRPSPPRAVPSATRASPRRTR